MKTVIMAGGKGTRITSIAGDIPKPMISIEGKPVLEREIECLRDQGFTDIIFCTENMEGVVEGCTTAMSKAHHETTKNESFESYREGAHESCLLYGVLVHEYRKRFFQFGSRVCA